jgi:hypothetical protein
MACVVRREKINALNAFVYKALRAGEKGWLKLTKIYEKYTHQFYQSAGLMY